MKNTLKILAATSLMVLSANAAQAEGYVGGSLGTSAMAPAAAENSVNNWNALYYPPGNDCDSLGCYVEEETSGALKIFGGYRVNPYFAVEGFFAYLGSFDSYANDGITVDVFESVEADTLGIAAVGLIPLGSGKVSLLGKLGLHSWSADGTVDLVDTDISTPPGIYADYSVSGTDGMGGIGVQIDFGERAAMRVEFEYFAINTDYSEFGVGLFSVGGMFRF